MKLVEIQFWVRTLDIPGKCTETPNLHTAWAGPGRDPKKKKHIELFFLQVDLLYIHDKLYYTD